jgi:sigma-B regulation protein RsbU (phosphoserine phosphatase)
MSDSLQYSTGFYGVVDRHSLDMRYSIAGSERPLWWHAKQKVLTFLEGEGIPLGMFGDYKYKNCKISLKPGDRVILYTDGVTDAVNAEGERYSINRFLSSVEKHCLREADDLTAALFEDVHLWTGKEPLADDVAIYVLHLNNSLPKGDAIKLAAEEKTGDKNTSLFE